jgi:hypothetical protein
MENYTDAAPLAADDFTAAAINPAFYFCSEP